MSAAFRIRETRGPEGWREVAINDAAGNLLAVITRPVSGAKWFLHRSGKTHGQREAFKTRKAAVSAVTGGDG